MRSNLTAARIYARIVHYSMLSDGIVNGENTLQAAAALAAHTLILNAEELFSFSSRHPLLSPETSYYEALRRDRAVNDAIAPSGEHFLEQIVQQPLPAFTHENTAIFSRGSCGNKQPRNLFVAAPFLPYVLSPVLRIVAEGADKKGKLEACAVLAKQISALALNDAVENNGMSASYAHNVFKNYFTKRLDIQPMERNDLKLLRTSFFAPCCNLGDH